MFAEVLLLMMFRRSVPLMLVVACLAASVVLSDMASSRTWLAGGHATPEQLALHHLYESLGIHDHHGHVNGGDHETDVGGGDPRGVVPDIAAIGMRPAWTVAASAGATDPAQVARDVRDVGPGVAAPLIVVMRLETGVQPQPASPDFLAPDPPPRRTA